MTRSRSGSSDLRHLRGTQYRTGANLRARISLHERFSTGPHRWYRWMFERLELPSDARLLELGCGTGGLWSANRERVPTGWRIVLSDASAGMVGEARSGLRPLGLHPACEVADAGSLPHRDGTCDAVIANHMLYHVPDRPAVFREIRRVLRPGGRLYASTNGLRHLREIDELVRRVAPAAPRDDHAERFGLENGAAQLEPWFERVTLARVPDALEVTETEPLVAYVLSRPVAELLDQAAVERLHRTVEETIASHGCFRAQKAVGLFSCRRPGSG
jgi:SAM-dependent methyltransferase